MTVLDDLASIVTTSWKENTVVWIVISGIIRGIVTQVLKFVFEQLLLQYSKP
jgi:hypothetical protein